VGGEEFAVVLVGVDPRRAGATAEEIRVMVSDQPITTSSNTISITVSIGLSGWCADIPGLPMSTESLLQQGDEALYVSKASGRNRITRAKSLAPRPTP
jgi:diguanylate cyclase (GGDEF)-like protein